MSVIAIAGSFGGLNIGDEAILTCMLARLRSAVADAELVVLSRNAGHTRANHKVDRVLPVRELTRTDMLDELQGVDLFLLGGGGLLFDGEARTYLHDVRLAQDVGVPTMAFAVGVGPLHAPDDRRVVCDTLERMDRISVRERPAKRLLEEIGVEHEIEVTADPALLLEPEAFTEEMLTLEAIDPRRRLIGVSVREPGGAAPELSEAAYHELIANAADFLAERFDADLVFVPMERGDIGHAHHVIANMAAAEQATVLRGDYSPQQILGLMEHLDFAVGMRLHFVIFAALASVPVVALPYAPKVMGFLEALALPVQVPLHVERPGRLLAHIDKLFDRRDEARALLARRVPELREAAYRTVALAVELLGRTPGDEAEARRDEVMPPT